MFEREILEPEYRAGGLPEGLAEMKPDVELARVLEGIDPSRLSGFDRVTVMQARARLVSHLQAELFSDMIGVAECMVDLVEPGSDSSDVIEDLAATEIRAALTLTRRSAEYQLELAHSLYERLPQVWVALYAGWIDLPRARVIAVDPEAAKKRYETGLADRRIASHLNHDGTANLCGLQLPAVETRAAMHRVNRMARAARTKDDPRTMDQIRADVLLDLLHGRGQRQGEERGVVDISVDLSTLAGLDDNPGSIPGWGPVIADVAR